MPNTYLLHCLDAPGKADIREANRAAHAEYMRTHANHIILGGPLLSEDGSTRIGITAVLRFDDHTALATFAENEPYRKAGLFDRISLHPIQVVMRESPVAHAQEAPTP